MRFTQDCPSKNVKIPFDLTYRAHWIFEIYYESVQLKATLENIDTESDEFSTIFGRELSYKFDRIYMRLGQIHDRMSRATGVILSSGPYTEVSKIDISIFETEHRCPYSPSEVEAAVRLILLGKEPLMLADNAGLDALGVYLNKLYNAVKIIHHVTEQLYLRLRKSPCELVEAE